MVAVLLEGVTDQLASTLEAMKKLDDTKYLAVRIEAMLERELDLRLEAKAFDAIRETPVGQSSLTYIPSVIVAAERGLLREVAPGLPLSAITRERRLDATELERLAPPHALRIRTAPTPSRTGSAHGCTNPRAMEPSCSPIRMGQHLRRQESSRPLRSGR